MVNDQSQDIFPTPVDQGVRAVQRAALHADGDGAIGLLRGGVPFRERDRGTRASKVKWF